MLSLLGHTFVLLAIAASGFGAVAGLMAARHHNPSLHHTARRAAYAFAACTWLANLTMITALLRHDFSVAYVAQVGSLSTPTWITIVSLWSSLEGSILFWTAIAGLYVVLLARATRSKDTALAGYAITVALLVSAFFTILVAGPADPFRALSPIPTDGPGPNPLLQNHILMAIHPPMLYLGYVGMMVPFAMAIAALLRGSLPPAWNKVMRRLMLIPWTFLSIGIVLGGWWAYEVLGWGGYWAWDPVENASFMPWLAATGYIHSSIVQEHRGQLRTWTLSLIISTFLLTILGTFMTRSGVFNSVHSFTQSPIGPVFLGFLALCTLVSVILIAGRSHLLEVPQTPFVLASRETAFLFNNLLLVVFTITVLIGTVFPLLAEAIQGVKLSVGEPYFDRMAAPITMMLVFLMGVGPSLPWGESKRNVFIHRMRIPTAAAIAAATTCFVSGVRSATATLSFALIAFAFAVTVRELITPFIERRQRKQEAWANALTSMLYGHSRRVGGYIVHLGVLLIAVGVTSSHAFRESTEGSLKTGDVLTIAPFTFRYVESNTKQETHRFSLGTTIDVSYTEGGKHITTLTPKLNFYPTQREPVGTPAVFTHHGRDLYVSLMAVENEGQRVSLRIFVIPMVSMIWWALPFFVLGSLIAMWPRNKRENDELA